MSGHSTANIVGEMGYNHYIDTKIESKDLIKGGLESNEIKNIIMKKDLRFAGANTNRGNHRHLCAHE